MTNLLSLRNRRYHSQVLICVPYQFHYHNLNVLYECLNMSQWKLHVVHIIIHSPSDSLFSPLFIHTCTFYYVYDYLITLKSKAVYKKISNITPIEIYMYMHVYYGHFYVTIYMDRLNSFYSQ